MNRNCIAASLALAVLAVIGFACPVAAGEERPFIGHLVAAETHTPLAPPFVSVDVEATGKAKHLGKFTLTSWPL